MNNSNALIPEATKNTLSLMLQDTAKKTKPVTVEKLINDHKATLNTLVNNGHSHDDIATILVTQGIQVPGSAIATLLTSSRKKKAAKDKQKPKEANLTVTAEQATAVIQEWQRLSEIRKGFTKQELVAAISDEIDQALSAGYDYDDIATMMIDKGLTIAASTLRKYHRAAKQPDDGTTHKTDITRLSTAKTPSPLTTDSNSNRPSTSSLIAEEFAL